jgi:hypothetical protein
LPSNWWRHEIGNANIEGDLEMQVDRAGATHIDLREILSNFGLLKFDRIRSSAEAVPDVSID